MEDISLHILDLAENGINAGATEIHITVFENMPADRLIVEITDNGRGMSAETLAKVKDPFFTTRITRKVGLGLPLFVRSCEEADGSVEIESTPGEGVKLRGEMRFSHIDRRPLGDMVETMVTLVMGSPQVRWVYRHALARDDGSSALAQFDTAEIGERVGTESLTHPQVIRTLRHNLREQEAALRY